MAKRPKPENTSKWRTHAFEFLTVFTGVTLAFVLNTWNENRKDQYSETKILTEIRNGLKKDTSDIHGNMGGHLRGKEAVNYFRALINRQPVTDSLAEQQFTTLLRSFVIIQNKSGYESLKSKGLETITNDSLRMDIISIYDYYFQIVEKLEEQYAEGQFFSAYFHEISTMLAPYMIYDQEGHLIGFKQPVNLSDIERNRMNTFLLTIERNRQFTLDIYAGVKVQAAQLIVKINQELESN
jgi:hypothetical protein